MAAGSYERPATIDAVVVNVYFRDIVTIVFNLDPVHALSSLIFSVRPLLILPHDLAGGNMRISVGSLKSEPATPPELQPTTKNEGCGCAHFH